MAHKQLRTPARGFLGAGFVSGTRAGLAHNRGSMHSLLLAGIVPRASL